MVLSSKLKVPDLHNYLLLSPLLGPTVLPLSSSLLKQVYSRVCLHLFALRMRAGYYSGREVIICTEDGTMTKYRMVYVTFFWEYLLGNKRRSGFRINLPMKGATYAGSRPLETLKKEQLKRAKYCFTNTDFDKF